MSNPGWSTIWLGQVVLVALALGCVLVRFPRWLPQPAWARFLTGFSLAPLVLGLWVIGLSYLAPGASRWVFVLGPIPLVLFPLALLWRPVLTRLGKSLRAGTRNWRKDYFLMASVVGLALTLLLLLYHVTWNLRLPISNADAIQYLSEAHYFSQSRTPESIIGYRGAADGSIRGDIHGFIFPAYLAQAMMAAPGPIGYPNDLAARLAFQVTFFFMLTATAALAVAMGLPGAAPLALILLLLVPELHYISSGCNRDAFRIIPLVLLAVAMLGLVPVKLSWRSLPALRLIALLAGLSISAHTLAAFALPGLVLAWLGCRLVRKAKLVPMIPVLVAIGLGALLGGVHYLAAYQETGSLRGSNVTADSILEGTVYSQGILNHYQGRVKAGNSTGRPLWALVSRDRGVLSIGGTMAAALMTGLLLPGWGRSLLRAIYGRFPWFRDWFWRSGSWLALTVLANSLIFTGLLDFGPYRISEWMMVNPRYALHWYPFAAVLVGGLIATLSRAEGSRRRLFLSFSVVAVLGFSILSLGTLKAWPRSDPTWFLGQLEPLEKEIGSLTDRNVCLSEADYLYYYFKTPVLFLYTVKAKPLFVARTMEEIDSFMAANSIGLVVLYSNFYMNLAGDQTPLARWLDDPARCQLVHDKGLLMVYRLKR